MRACEGRRGSCEPLHPYRRSRRGARGGTAQTSSPPDEGHLGDRFWGQVRGFSGRFKASWGRDRLAAELVNLRAKALYERESAAHCRESKSSMVRRGSTVRVRQRAWQNPLQIEWSACRFRKRRSRAGTCGAGAMFARRSHDARHLACLSRPDRSSLPRGDHLQVPAGVVAALDHSAVADRARGEASGKHGAIGPPARTAISSPRLISPPSVQLAVGAKDEGPGSSPSPSSRFRDPAHALAGMIRSSPIHTSRLPSTPTKLLR
jgi:hypothetical protein